MSAIRKTLAGIALGGALTAGVASTAGAAPPVVIGGGSLVTVQVVDVLSGNQVSVQVPIGVAANVCGVVVGVIAEQQPAPVDCTSATTLDLPVAFQR